MHQFLSFAIAAFCIVLIPGPNMTFLISSAVAHGRKAAIFGLLGSNAALVSLGLITGMGLSTLLKAVPVLYDIIKIGGAVYLFWLAWKNILFAKNNDEDKIKVKGKYSNFNAFKTGYFTNILNPKSAAFYVAIFPAFLNPHAGHMALQGILLGSIHAAVSLIVNVAIIFSVRSITLRYNFGSRMKAVKKWGTTVVFTAFGIKMLLQKNV